MTRYARRKDNTQSEVEKALRAAGWEVHDLSRVGWGVPDLIARKAGYKLWVEVKSEDDPKLTPAEMKFHAICPGDVITVMSGAQAVVIAETMHRNYLSELKVQHDYQKQIAPES